MSLRVGDTIQPEIVDRIGLLRAYSSQRSKSPMAQNLRFTRFKRRASGGNGVWSIGISRGTCFEDLGRSENQKLILDSKSLLNLNGFASAEPPANPSRVDFL